MAKRLAQLNDLDMKLAHFPQLPDLQNRLCLCFLIRLHKSPFSSKPPRFVNFNREKKKARPQKETRPSVCLVPKILNYRAKTALSCDVLSYLPNSHNQTYLNSSVRLLENLDQLQV